MPVNERRFLTANVRSMGDESKKCVSGYAARFGVLSDNLGGFRERLARGCFASALKSTNIAMLADHDASKILGRTGKGTLTLREDSEGLTFRCELPDTSVANDVYHLVKRGDLGECSFGFTCSGEQWAEEPDPDDQSRRVAVRTVTGANLFEISLVTFPAYPNTSAAISRSLFPAGLPLEVRSRAPHAGNPSAQISDAEYLDRLRARRQAERLLAVR